MRKVYKILEDSRWSSDISCISKDGYNVISSSILSFAIVLTHSSTAKWNLCALPMDLGRSCNLFGPKECCRLCHF